MEMTSTNRVLELASRKQMDKDDFSRSKKLNPNPALGKAKRNLTHTETLPN